MGLMPPATASLVDAVRTLAIEAGEAILEVYGADDPGVRQKADRTPVTEADLRAEALILRGLAKIAPDVPVVAEESVAAGSAPTELGERFWLVDPLDGTKEFLSHNGEFTVNIALVEEGAPTLGVVHLPAVGLTYVGAPGIAAMTDQGAQPRPLGVVAAPVDGLRALVSRSHLDPDTERWLAGVDVASFVQAGSSLKFCRIAEGVADVYPRFGRTMEWDTAAGHAVLVAAGGSVCTTSGQPLGYAKPGFENPPFIACGGTPSLGVLS